MDTAFENKIPDFILQLKIGGWERNPLSLLAIERRETDTWVHPWHKVIERQSRQWYMNSLRNLAAELANLVLEWALPHLMSWEKNFSPSNIRILNSTLMEPIENINPVSRMRPRLSHLSSWQQTQKIQEDELRLRYSSGICLARRVSLLDENKLWGFFRNSD